MLSLFASKMFPDSELFLLKQCQWAPSIDLATTSSRKVCLSAFLNSAFKILFSLFTCLSFSLSVCLFFSFFETKPGEFTGIQIFTCLLYLSAGIKGLHHHTWLHYYSLLYHIRIILLFCFDLWSKVFLCICSQFNLDFSFMDQPPKC